MTLVTSLTHTLHLPGQEGEPFGPWEEVMLQDGKVIGLAVLYTRCVLLLSESTALGKQAELQRGKEEGKVGSVEKQGRRLLSLPSSSSSPPLLPLPW